LPSSAASCARRIVVDRDFRPGDRSAAVAISAAAAVFLLGAALLAGGAESESDDVVRYYDGDVLVGEERTNGGKTVLRDYDPPRVGDATFFGWTTEPDGVILHPAGSEMFLSGGTCLYAAVCYGLIEVDGNTAIFRLGGPPLHTSPLLIDLRHAGSVTSVIVPEDTGELIRSAGASVKVAFHNGLRLHLDSVYSAQIMNGRAEIGYAHENGDVVRLDVLSDGERLEWPDGGLSAAMNTSPVHGADTVVFCIDGGAAAEIQSTVFDGEVSFAPPAMRFRAVTLLPVNASVDGHAAELGSAPIGFRVVRSDYFHDRGMLAVGDVFSLGQAPEGRRFAVSGTEAAAGVFVATGASTVRIALTAAGAGAHSIILPETQTGYTIASDASEVNDGGNCVLTYRLLHGYTDYDLAIAVNGNVYELNSLGEIHLNDVRTDMFVTVEGVYDSRVYTINVPQNQIGYALSVSSNTVHHGMSYMVSFTLKPGYGGSPSVRIAGGQNIGVSSGTAVVSDVRGDHQLLVDGVELSRYKVTAGSNTIVFVNGVPGDTATINDIITIKANPLYSLPSSFESHIPASVNKVAGGYKTTQNVVFPSIVKLTVGENLVCNGVSEFGTLDVCTEDRVIISSELGYTLPNNYNEIMKLYGTIYNAPSGPEFKMRSDTTLPSIYRVTYMGYESVHEVVYSVGNYAPSLPQSVPLREEYLFDRWIFNMPIASDVAVEASWIREIFWIDVSDRILVYYEGAYRMNEPQLRVKLGNTIDVLANSSTVAKVESIIGVHAASFISVGLQSVLSSTPVGITKRYAVHEGMDISKLCIMVVDDAVFFFWMDTSDTINLNDRLMDLDTYGFDSTLFSHWEEKIRYNGSQQSTDDNKFVVLNAVWK
jgi:hypothetical protein